MCVFSVNSRHLSWKNTLTTKRCMLPTAPGMQHRRGSVCKTMETLHLSRRLLALAAVKSPTASQLERGMIPANTPLIHTTVGRYSAAFISPQKKKKNGKFYAETQFIILVFCHWFGMRVCFILSCQAFNHSLRIHHIRSFVDMSKQKGKKQNIAVLAFPRYAAAGVMLRFISRETLKILHQALGLRCPCGVLQPLSVNLPRPSPANQQLHSL